MFVDLAPTLGLKQSFFQKVHDALVRELGFSLGDLDAYDAMCGKFLVEKYPASTLPLHISLAIDCEARLHESLAQASFIRSHHKRLSKLLPQREYERNALLRGLFEAPIERQISRRQLKR